MASKHRGAERAGKAPSQRQLRVGEELRHTLAEILQRGDFHDPELQGLNVTVTEVRISPDLKNATAFVTPLGGGPMDETLSALRRAAPFLRGQVARIVNLRHAPTLGFEADTSFEYAGRIDAILHSPAVARDLLPDRVNGDDGDDEDDEDEDSWEDEDEAAEEFEYDQESDDPLDDPLDDPDEEKTDAAPGADGRRGA
ncbi:30S ribosome-binding factor RbfA [Azospirillum sp. ST 5-10]|uniref:30S ribosome-binding factor RbfA n=1 Tax=unclassified Azospirillum TaxID=2630922 RepID=UPI003F4A31F9